MMIPPSPASAIVAKLNPPVCATARAKPRRCSAAAIRCRLRAAYAVTGSVPQWSARQPPRHHNRSHVAPARPASAERSPPLPSLFEHNALPYVTNPTTVHVGCLAGTGRDRSSLVVARVGGEAVLTEPAHQRGRVTEGRMQFHHHLVHLVQPAQVLLRAEHRELAAFDV